MALKIVFFFNQASQGWTETWYNAGTDPIQYLNGWRDADFQALVTWRTYPTTLFAIRATTTTLPRRTYSLPLQGKYYGQGFLPLAIRPDPASTDAMYRVVGVLGKRRQLAVRGLLDDMVQRDTAGLDIETALLKTGIQTYMTTIAAKGLGILYQKRPGDAVNPPLNVLQVAPDPANTNQSIITLANAMNPALPVPRMINASGVPTNDLPGFPKRVNVVAINLGPPHVMTVGYRFRAATNTVNPARMKLIEQEEAIDALGFWGFLGFHERKTGRPFGVPRGRARPLVRAH